MGSVYAATTPTHQSSTNNGKPSCILLCHAAPWKPMALDHLACRNTPKSCRCCWSTLSAVKHASPSWRGPSKGTHLVRDTHSVTPIEPRTPHASWRVCANNHCRVAGCKSSHPEPLVQLAGSLSLDHPRKRNKRHRFQTAAGSNACEPLAADSIRPGQQTIPPCGVSTGQWDSSQAKLLSLGGSATAPPSAGGPDAARPAFHTRS